ncbi:MAG TPA: AIR synthase-related protein, partial [Thermoleophilia bacterium]|nr:AIR synthase-related protein [Thermoleophilia bacterium]
ELIHRELVVSMQDLGAAGLTSSSSEMSSKGHVGLDIHADRVPLREAGMEPWEIMISESQERMLAIVADEQLADVREVCDRWDLDCTVIGEVTDSKKLRVYWHGERVADIPSRRLADESPVIRTPSVKPAYVVDEPVAVTDAAYPQPQDHGAALLQLLAAPNIASKRWAWEQYDYIVQANTVQIPGSDAAVLRLKGTPRGIAFTNDCNGRHCYLDPYRGAKAATAEAARNLACAGALPVAVTDCLNFGNPEKGEIYWQFEQAIEGIAEACEALDTPVVSGNVSFYNESFGQAIYPTPLVGMLGVFDDVSVHIDAAFKDEGDVVLLLGDSAAWMDGSEYQKVAYGRVEGRVPDVDLELEVKLQARLRAAIEARLLKSAHDCAEGGLAVALAECCVFGGVNGGAQWADPEAPRAGRSGRWLGAEVDLGAAADVVGAAGRPDLALFGEAPTRVVVSCAPERVAELEAVLGDLPHRVIGRVAGADLRCTMEGEELITVPVAELHSAYESLPQRLT